MTKRGHGRENLIDAARLEFEDFGFDGTTSNAIAKRANYAPQTFYRHFDDKTAIFIAVYQVWSRGELRDVLDARSPEAIADVLLHHHQRYRIFRRSLRMLTATNANIGEARAAARLLQVETFKAHFKISDLAWGLARLMLIERLCDAIADGEFEACGIADAVARRYLIDAIEETITPT